MLKLEDRPPVSKPLKEIIFGYLAGDGFLKASGALQVEQGKNQRKFVDWMYDKLQVFCTEKCEIKPVLESANSKNPGQLRSYRFYTKAWFKDYHQMWYQKQGTKFVKKLPDNIDQMLTPLFISVWFACDGTKPDDCRGAKIDVTAFTVEEREHLKNLFFQKYQINAKINKQGLSKKKKEQWALCILAEDYDKFYALVTKDPLIPTLFPNKLCKKP